MIDYVNNRIGVDLDRLIACIHSKLGSSDQSKSKASTPKKKQAQDGEVYACDEGCEGE